jgi:type I restriction enzyme S subunit
MNGKIMRLEECCLSISDGDHQPPPKASNGIPFITISNVDATQNIIDFSSCMFVSESYYDKVDSKRKAQKNDILYSVVGSYGIPVLIRDDEKFVFQRHIAILRPNTKVILPEFLYYTMKSSSFYMQADAYAVGAAQRTISLTSLRKMKILVPPLAIQQEIVKSLCIVDSLIETNNKRIKLLEQMAENLYKEWFVRFRFPGHENEKFVETRIGKMPESFKVIKMQDAVLYYIGGGWGNDVSNDEFPIEACVIRGTDFPNVKKGNISTCPLRYHKVNNYKARELQNFDVILEVSGGTAEQPVGRTLLVTQDIIDRLGGKVICASFCKQMRLDRDIVSPVYFYYWMQFLYDVRIIDRFQSQSTGIINFKFDYFLKKGDIMLPSKDVMEKFGKAILPLHNEISLLAMQNENLAKQRDLLLPRLMSGKLEVH